MPGQIFSWNTSSWTWEPFLEAWRRFFPYSWTFPVMTQTVTLSLITPLIYSILEMIWVELRLSSQLSNLSCGSVTVSPILWQANPTHYYYSTSSGKRKYFLLQKSHLSHASLICLVNSVNSVHIYCLVLYLDTSQHCFSYLRIVSSHSDFWQLLFWFVITN